MTKTITSVFLTALLASAFSVSAATTPENTDDASALGTSDTPQIKQQDRRIDKKMRSAPCYARKHKIPRR